MERCPYCFKPLPEDGECSCHYEDSRNARIEEALRPGTVVGACYQIGAVLGQGGFGITYRGFDLNMQKVVAIKEFYPKGLVVRYGTVSEKAISAGRSNYVRTVNTESHDVFLKSLDLFYREAVALGRLDKQPNVVHAHQIFRENGTAYIVMEFVEGQSLNTMIWERGRIPEKELLPLLDPVLTALDRVHQEGILHRDIAPDNIMIEDGKPVLLDFGASRVEEGHHSSLVIGKKGFSSVEQMTGEIQDRRSDIYAMGATYYNALSGVPPQDAAMRGVKDKVIPLKDLVPEISEGTSDAVAKAMALNPDDRWNTAAEFRDALRGNQDAGEKDYTYRTALKLMNAGTEEGFSGAMLLFNQIPGYKDTEELAKECLRRAADLRKQSRPDNMEYTGNRVTAPLSTVIFQKRKNILPFILIAAVAAGIAVYFILRSGKLPEKTDVNVPAAITEKQPGTSEQEMTMTVRAVYSKTSAASTHDAKLQQTIDADLTAIAIDHATGTASYYETETGPSRQTKTPVPPADTPIPTAEVIVEPTATDTPKPSETLRPTATNTPKPTKTPKPTATGTPIPTATVIPTKISADWEIENGVLIKYKGDESYVTIPDGVTSIGKSAFSGCKKLSSVTIPDSVTSIGESAFYGCSNLSSVTIPKSVTSIGGGAFYGCSNLSSVMIPDSVTSIENSVFSGCKKLSSVTIPDSVTSIGGYAFFGCSSLSSVKIPDSVTSIGEYAFADCTGLSSVTIPGNVTSISDYAFSGCTGFKSVVIPDRVTSIGDAAFSRCSNLRSVTIPDSVISIGKWAFSRCTSLSSVMIPDSVISIGEYAFAGCTSLRSVAIPNKVTSIRQETFAGCTSLRSVAIPNSVISIELAAFMNCTGLDSVTIPNSVRSIGYHVFESQTTIIVSKNSYAERWCGENKLYTCIIN